MSDGGETGVGVSEGDGPLILAVPHAGTDIPILVFGELNQTGRAIADTDFHVDRLYADLLPGATTVRTTVSRYVIDANRDPSGKSLYPGQNTTGLCPTTDFEGRPIYRDGGEPGPGEVRARLRRYHAPYHAALAEQIARAKARHGLAVLYDCHSIRSEIPFLFEGRLPDFNVGTNDGRSCDPGLEQTVAGICAAAEDYTSVVNGRFKGGWTTRYYGDPANGVHAVQMELSQATYMLEAWPWTYSDERAARLRLHLKALLDAVDGWARARSIQKEAE